MQLKSILTVLAAGAAMVVADDVDTTVTSTSTLTQTVTVTQCNPTVTDCPRRTSTIHETTTWGPSSVIGIDLDPTTRPASSFPANTPTTFTTPAPTTTRSATPTAIVTAGVGGLVVQPAVLLGVLGAGVALLA